MPELPEVETIVRGLRPLLSQRRITRAWLRYKSLYRRGSLKIRWLEGRSVRGIERVGKNAVFQLDPNGLMLVNLGMTGRLIVWRGESAPAGVDPRHLHARLHFDGGSELRYYDARRFGHVYVAETCDFAKDLNVGPDPFIAGAGYLKNTLRRREASIKSLLLDQRIISGIGNIYADETLFFAGIDPRTPGYLAAGDTRRILVSARSVLRRAIAHGGSTLRDYRRQDGSTGEFQRYHAVYGRKGKACVHCGASIRKVVIGGRGTHFCPECQK